MSSIALIDYGSGNLRSAAKAFERAALELPHPPRLMVTADPDVVRRADRVVLPGVGAFGDCKRGLAAIDGMIEALDESVRTRGRPFLGICVGMQLMAREGHEHGTTPGLDWIGGTVEALSPSDPTLKIPHMGWNELRLDRPDHPVLNGIQNGQHAYFVHSYHLVTDQPDTVMARVDYGGPVTAMVGRGTMVGTQFHPEKSQATGLRLIRNFLTWTP
jgi:glutamine amidotransferase